MTPDEEPLLAAFYRARDAHNEALAALISLTPVKTPSDEVTQALSRMLATAEELATATEALATHLRSHP
jgi:hypothetical protein